jgi:hypothetical protein
VPELDRLRHGQSIPFADLPQPPAGPDEKLDVAVFDASDTLVAVAKMDSERRLLVPAKVLWTEGRVSG